jgi:hypothetical protein
VHFLGLVLVTVAPFEVELSIVFLGNNYAGEGGRRARQATTTACSPRSARTWSGDQGVGKRRRSWRRPPGGGSGGEGGRAGLQSSGATSSRAATKERTGWPARGGRSVATGRQPGSGPDQALQHAGLIRSARVDQRRPVRSGGRCRTIVLRAGWGEWGLRCRWSARVAGAVLRPYLVAGNFRLPHIYDSRSTPWLSHGHRSDPVGCYKVAVVGKRAPSTGGGRTGGVDLCHRYMELERGSRWQAGRLSA